jgi:RNA:NAD 2'-phosphotransferase (TPT1/KptA family)
MERVSRNLTRILRHKAAEEGFHIDAAGYVAVAELLAHASLRGVSEADIRKLVADCPKQRFALQEREGGALFVRANQGHTLEKVDDDQLLTRIDTTNLHHHPCVVHGTYRKNLASILATGLRKMQRNHIHFASVPGLDVLGRGKPQGGLRASAEVFIELNLPAALEAGIPVFVSANGVVLTPGVGETGLLPTAFFKRVLERRPDGRVVPLS